MSANYKHLRSQYKDEFIVIRDKRIIGHAKEIEDIVRFLNDNQIDPTTIVVDFVTEDRISLLRLNSNNQPLKVDDSCQSA